jgi:signal transduction histidine kinase
VTTRAGAPVGGRDLFPPIVAGLAAVAAVAAVVADPGTSAENAVALVGVLPVVAWSLAPDRISTAAVVVVVSATALYVLGSGGLEMWLFVLSVASVACGTRESSNVRAAIALVVASLTPVVAEVLHQGHVFVAVWVLAMVMPWALGRSDRAQVAMWGELVAAREDLARQAVLDERRRIARDVHDLVGHGLAAVMLHVTGARHVLRRDLAAADEALAEAEAVGRRSLHELGRTLSLLRAEGEGGAAAPVPSAADITAAVEAAGATGADVRYRSVGDVGRVDPIVGLCLYRVAEEALTNARRHAPAAVTDVVLTVDGDVATLAIDSRGPVAPADPRDADRRRFGLVGMRERMTAIGGEIDAGPTAGGWLVHCRAPLRPDQPPPGRTRPIGGTEAADRSRETDPADGADDADGVGPQPGAVW